MGAKEKLNLELEFDDSNISLDIPLPSGVDVNEWSLVPHVLPMVMFVNCYQYFIGSCYRYLRKESTPSSQGEPFHPQNLKRHSLRVAGTARYQDAHT